jgi:uncharacterized protein YjbI with pentapeptide repeats
MPNLSTEEPWQKLERDVEALFRSAGYDTERNVEVGGFEFDVIATRTEFAGLSTRIAIECKYRENGSVSNTDTHAFLNAFNATKARLSLTHGILVTNRKFSRQAHEAINQSAVAKLLTFDNLADELLGTHIYLTESSKRYRSSIRGTFIDLNAIRENQQKSAKVQNISNDIVDIIGESAESLTLLLGDFGCGKTSISEHIHMRLAQNYASGASSLFPFIFYLRTLSQFDADNAFIASQTAMLSRNISPEMFSRVQSAHSSVVILDGFDEVATNATREERHTLFSRAVRIAQQSNHIIITSRPSYFSNIQELNQLIQSLIARDQGSTAKMAKAPLRKDVDRSKSLEATAKLGRRFLNETFRLFSATSSYVYHIQPFTRGDVESYLQPFSTDLRRRHGKNVSEIYDILMGIYDITDLIRRPLLLDMFLDILLDGEINLRDPDLEIGPAGLYQIYVNLHLDRDWKVRQFLTRDERLTFARAAAIAMLESGGQLEASYKSIDTVISRGMTEFSESRNLELDGQAEKVATDVRVCSFINITPNNKIEFSHKSFMEYFVADVICQKLSSGRNIEELGMPLNYEILYFLGSFSLSRTAYIIDILSHISHVGRTADERYHSNLMVAFIFSERVSRNRHYRRINFGNLRISKREFINCQFSDISLSRLTLEKVEFTDCEFSSSELGGEFVQVVFANCRGTVNLSGPLAQTQIYGKTGFKIRSAENLTFQRGTMSESDLIFESPMVKFSKFEIDRSTLTVDQANVIEFVDCKLSNSSFVQNHLTKRRSSPVGLSFSRAKLMNIVFNGILIHASSLADFLAKCDHCRGWVFVDDADKSAKQLTSGNDGNNLLKYVGWSVIDGLVLLSYQLFGEVNAADLSGVTSERRDSGDLRDQISRYLSSIK